MVFCDVKTVGPIAFVATWTCEYLTMCDDMNLTIASMVGSTIGPKGLSLFFFYNMFGLRRDSNSQLFAKDMEIGQFGHFSLKQDRIGISCTVQRAYLS